MCDAGSSLDGTPVVDLNSASTRPAHDQRQRLSGAVVCGTPDASPHPPDVPACRLCGGRATMQANAPALTAIISSRPTRRPPAVGANTIALTPSAAPTCRMNCWLVVALLFERRAAPSPALRPLQLARHSYEPGVRLRSFGTSVHKPATLRQERRQHLRQEVVGVHVTELSRPLWSKRVALGRLRNRHSYDRYTGQERPCATNRGMPVAGLEPARGLHPKGF